MGRTPARAARAAPAAVALAAALAALAGCAAPRTPDGPAPEPLSLAQEVELGRAVADEFERAAGGRLDDLAVHVYVGTVGERVVRGSATPGVPYAFLVLADREVNGFALPGGLVYVTRGLLERLDTEAQLAAVLGHLMAHLAAGHTTGDLADSLGTAGLGRAASDAAARKTASRDSPRRAESLGRVAEALARVRYTPEMERDADRLALDYLAAAGYNPGEAVRLVERLAAMDGPMAPALFAGHPGPGARVEAVRDAVRRKYPGRGGRVGQAEYRREVLDRLGRTRETPGKGT